MVREENKEARRQRTLNAAAALIRQTGSTDFSMVTLATQAKLCPATPYNLFGSKGAILYALLNRSLDEIAQGGERNASTRRNPFLRTLHAAEWGARFFISDPAFYRPLYRFLLGLGDPVYRPAYMDRSLDYWRNAVAGIDGQAELPAGVGTEEIARQLLLQFVGALDLWVQEELGDPEFAAQIRYGAGLLLLGIAEGAQRTLVLKNMRAQRKRLPATLRFTR